MDDDLDELYEDFLEQLANKTPSEAFRKLRRWGVDEALLTKVQERYEEEALAVREQGIAPSVVVGGRSTWYTGPQSKDKYWPAIRSKLQKSGWSAESLEELDKSTSQIVGLLDHPKTPEFSTKGLVLGHVQSGKTTNFTAVIAKAADRNYKLFIVLAGIHNSLRRQTQVRLRNDLIGEHHDQWIELTNPDSDFTPPPTHAISYFASNNRQKVLCVIKKNATVLRKFREWLRGAEDHLRECPTLIIDDEADQATVATERINPLIMDIVDSLPKSVYLGYTATPFANLLIDPASSNLYPKDFIVSLPQPKFPYFGNEVLFGREPLDAEDEVFDGYDMIRIIDDSEVPLVRPASRADADGFVPSITGSLRTSVLYFWLATAARRVRRTGNKHSTMLIHTSVKTSVHESFHEPLARFQESVQDRIQDLDPRILGELEGLWKRENAAVPAGEFGLAPVDFDEVLEMLPSVLSESRIIIDNATSRERLDYEGQPVVAIAIGGNTLSRGLTLEGLAVSYFVRSVSAYDSLLQMARWFGYRSGYEDLPRIWLTEELRGWFRHLATVETEIRRDIDRYMAGNDTPTSFAVRIRTHPSLLVTSAAKMADAVEVYSAFGGRRIQTHFFDVSPSAVEDNLSALRGLISSLDADHIRVEADGRHSRYLWRNAGYKAVTRFLREYSYHPESFESSNDVLIEYIEKRVRQSELLTWNIAIVGKPTGDPSATVDLGHGIAPGRVVRSRLEGDVVDIKTLMSRRDAALDLNLSKVSKEQPLTEEEIFTLRRVQLPHTGLLVLYVIDKDSAPNSKRPSSGTKRVALDAPDDLVGFGLVFPPADGEDSQAKHTYVSADLSGIEIEEIDDAELDALEHEELP